MSRWQAAQARCLPSDHPEVVLAAQAVAGARAGHRVREASPLHPLRVDPAGRHLHLLRAGQPPRLDLEDLEGPR
jgi:hypothetical protein